MPADRRGKAWVVGLTALALAASLAVVALFGIPQHFPVPDRAHVPTTETVKYDSARRLSDAEARQVRDWIAGMMDPGSSEQAADQLRQHIQKLLINRSSKAASTMVLAVECLAAKFDSLDASGRHFGLGLLADVLAWHGENSTSYWGGLLVPAKSLLGKALDDSSPAVQLPALRVAGACSSWQPKNADRPAQRKALATWKAELQELCWELLGHDDEEIRAAAAVTVASASDESTASKSLALLKDQSALVRGSVLLALSDRAEVLPSEDILSLLNDSDARVRSTADLVLRCRGVSREEIILAVRATHPSALVRSQAPLHILESRVVDRVVWLTHLSRDQSAEVRVKAAYALARIGDKDCWERIGEVARADPDADVRATARELIVQLGGSDPREGPTVRRSSTSNLPLLRAPKVN